MKGVTGLRDRTRLAAAALCILWFLYISGCSAAFDLLPKVRLQIHIPKSTWQNAGVPVAHRVVYPDRYGDLQTLFLPAGLNTAVIEVQRGYNVPVVAYPLGRLPPAGGCVSSHIQLDLFGSNNVLPLRYRYGPAAQLLQELWHLSERCQTVCIEALVTEQEKKGDGDPWNCDFDRIKGALVRGRLNRLHVRSMNTTSITIELPVEDWIPGNLFFQGAIEVDREGENVDIAGGVDAGGANQGEKVSVRFSGLYPGRHLFFSPTSGLELHIYADKKGGCRYVCDSLANFAFY
ncbi:MAG TPA: hypothetical protein VJ967_02630 [Clostridia bacterium]|nr:hypothetical protein [Clostridia bacterium]